MNINIGLKRNTRLPTIPIENIWKRNNKKRLKNRIYVDKIVKNLFFATTGFSFVILAILFYKIISQSIGYLTFDFLTSRLSIFPDRAGIESVILGSVLLMMVVIPSTLILGISTAIYLEKYASKNKFTTFVQTNIANLAGVPSVIFGLLGLTIFVRLFNMGASVLAGGLTLSLLVLPIVIVASQEAIKAVPSYLIDASYGLGASKWTTILKVVLPCAFSGILTGSILAVSRAIGETAPLIVVGVPALILKSPSSLLDNFTALPIQIYYWTIDAVLKPEFINLAASSIVVLLVILIAMNSVAVIIRNKFQKSY